MFQIGDRRWLIADFRAPRDFFQFRNFASYKWQFLQARIRRAA
jgi:hypothetical protein